MLIRINFRRYVRCISVPLAIPFVTGRFARIIWGLCHAVPKLIARDRSAEPLIILIFTRLRRVRFTRAPLD